MSDNIMPLHPQQDKRKKLRRLLLSLGGAVLLILLAVSLILFHEELNLDKARRFITYLNARGSGSYGVYAFDAHSASDFCAFDDGLAVGSVAGLEIYGDSGESRSSTAGAASVPAVSAGGDLVLFWDVGGNILCAADALASALELKTDHPLLDADISPGDEICYAVPADGYKTVLTVLDDEQQDLYKWYSASRYFSQCAVAEGGELLAAVELGQVNGAFESRLQLFSTDSEEAGPSATLGSQLILELDFVEDGVLCAVGESRLHFLDTDGAALGSYDYGEYLTNYDLGGDGFVTVATNLYRAGSRSTVATVDLDGEKKAARYIGEEILSISAAGRYVAVLTADSLLILKSDLTAYAETADTGGASGVIMREDGSALLVGSGWARLYLP